MFLIDQRGDSSIRCCWVVIQRLAKRRSGLVVECVGIVTSAEEGGYVFGSVFLSVCLFVCLSVGLLANL